MRTLSKPAAYGLAVGLSVGLIAGFSGMTAQAAQPQVGDISNARAQALNLVLAGQEIPADVLTPAIAENSGAPDVANVLPLDLGPLEDLGLSLGPADLLGDGGFLALGALNQVTTAAGDGTSSAAAGAVSDLGAIDIPAKPTPADSGASFSIGTDTVGLGDLLELNVDLGAIASTAELPANGPATGDFELSNLGIGMGGSMIGDIAAPIDDAIAPVADQLTTLGGLLGVDDLAIENPLAGGTLTVSEQDILKAAEVNALNELPAGTDLLSYLPGGVVNALMGVVDDLVAQVESAVEQLKGSAQFGTVCAPPLLPPNPACGVLDTAVGTVADALKSAVDTVVETVIGTLSDTLPNVLSLPVGTEVVGDDGSFALTALTALAGPGGSLGQLDLATSSVGPNAVPN